MGITYLTALHTLCCVAPCTLPTWLAGSLSVCPMALLFHLIVWPVLAMSWRAASPMTLKVAACPLEALTQATTDACMTSQVRRRADELCSLATPTSCLMQSIVWKEGLACQTTPSGAPRSHTPHTDRCYLEQCICMYVHNTFSCAQQYPIVCLL